MAQPVREPLRVLMLNYEYPPLGGGAANATAYLLREFSRRDDILVDLVTSSVDGPRVEQLGENVTIHFLDIGKRGNVHYQSNGNLLRYAWRARRYCRQLKSKKNFDLVHAWFGIPSGFVAMGLDLPYLVSLRGSDVPFYNRRFALLDRLIFQRLSRRIWRKACNVTANSQGLRQLAAQTAPDLEIPVIVNGVDTNQFHPVDKDESTRPFTVISTSRLIERKGIRDLIAGFSEFAQAQPMARLLLVGSGDLEPELRKQVQTAGLDQQISFLGAVPHERLPDLYRQADVFVLPSHNEGMSNSLLEAMASGLAVVTTDTGGTSELVSHKTGLVIERSKPQQITEALIELKDNTMKMLDLKAGSRSVAQMSGWDQFAREYLNLYTVHCLKK